MICNRLGIEFLQKIIYSKRYGYGGGRFKIK